MRVLISHNLYQQRGGEDTVVEAELALLRSHGHDVELYSRHNDELNHTNRVKAAASTLWSSQTEADLTQLVERFKPDVIHSHNTFPLVSPSLYWAASRLGVPVVQTLHNFRLFCLQAMFLRNEQVCEDCVGHLPWRGVARRCYRGSVAQSAVLCGTLGLHRALGTYRGKVTRYIALNEFCRGKFIAGGLPADRLVVKPNFIADPGAPTGERGSHFLYVGRLSVEKGISTLGAAWRHLGAEPGELRVAGTGPEGAALQGQAGLRLLGSLNGEQVLGEMHSARALVLPSIWYENFPRTLVEAFASGLPVIASRIGALAELVDEGQTGLLFEPGNGAELAAKLRWAQAHPQEMARMGQEARARYEREFSAEANHTRLIDIYQEAINAERR
jgi:glycosyltransferase involved in cell wall biosynthesis